MASRLALGNGTGASWTYYETSQVRAISHSNGGGLVAYRGCSYDPVGRRTAMVVRQLGTGELPDVYTHDAVDQIQSVRYALEAGMTNRAVDYVHDAVGNRQQVTDNGVATGYEVNELNQYTAVGGAALSYSVNGNLVAKPGAAFAYDAQNRMASAVNGSNSVAFAYDGRNRCVARTVNGVTTWMIWDEWSLIEERDAAGGVQAAYVHGPRIDEVLARIVGETALFYHEDALGSVAALTDGTGALVEQYQYDVFGLATILDGNNQPLGASAVGNRFLFTGREWLPELGLYDYRNRVYSPVLGRWLQPDPIGFDARDVNLYRYCGNGPHSLVDPNGEDAMWYVASAVNVVALGIVQPIAQWKVDHGGRRSGTRAMTIPFLGGGLVTRGKNYYRYTEAGRFLIDEHEDFHATFRTTCEVRAHQHTINIARQMLANGVFPGEGGRPLTPEERNDVADLLVDSLTLQDFYRQPGMQRLKERIKAKVW